MGDGVQKIINNFFVKLAEALLGAVVDHFSNKQTKKLILKAFMQVLFETSVFPTCLHKNLS